MHLAEFFGYVASALVFATFYMKSMMRLRIVAIASNITFITYAAIDGLTPILILHVALLPLNVLRFLQIRDFIKQVELAAKESFSVEAIAPLMERRKVRANETLFSINDAANELYYVADGTLFLPELQKEVGPNNFLGEFALFSEAGRRTATAIARTDCAVMILTRTALFSAILQHPRLAIHLLKLITARLLQNAERDQHLPGPAVTPGQPANDAGRPRGLFSSRARRNGWRLAAVASFVVLIALFHPLYTVLNRDAVVTAWANVVTAPISGTVEDFEARPGRRLADTGQVARIVNLSADRSATINAAAAAKRAEARLEQLKIYNARVSELISEWRDRKTQYAGAFQSDLDSKVQDAERQVSLLRAVVAGATPRQRDLATASQRESQNMLAETVRALEQLRHRRDLAGRGIYLQEDGKEPEWSSRSLDETRLDEARSARLLRDVEAEVRTSTTMLAAEEKNFDATSIASLKVPAGMTIWSASAANGSTVARGERLFTWIDCSRLLVDVPVSDTMAALVMDGTNAEVTLEGERETRKATVVLSRGASSRLTKAELVAAPTWRPSDAQVVVAFTDSEAPGGCPVGRRAFVRFPDIGLKQYLRAFLPPLQ